MTFKSKKDILFTIIIYGVSALLIGITVFGFLENKNGILEISLVTLFCLLVIAFLFWIYFGTYYVITNKNELIYRSGPIRGKIDIHQITEIISGKTLWVGLRPATSRNGIIIKYEKYNEIYISPVSNELIIQELIAINPSIRITT